MIGKTVIVSRVACIFNAYIYTKNVLLQFHLAFYCLVKKVKKCFAKNLRRFTDNGNPTYVNCVHNIIPVLVRYLVALCRLE